MSLFAIQSCANLSSSMIVYHGSNLSVDDVDYSAVVETSDLISQHSDEAQGRNCLETGLTFLSGDLSANLPPLRLMWTAELAAPGL